MGLDMYLTKRTYVKRWSHIAPEHQFKVTVERGGQAYEPIRSDRITNIIEEVAYWRKANAIHRWFVANVQNGEDDCGEYSVSTDQLAELLAAAKQASEAADPAAVLPTQGGFFFGNTDYGEDYKADLADTIRQLEPLLAEDNTQSDLFYRASW